MSDPMTNPARMNDDEQQSSLERQISDLKEQVSRLSAQVSNYTREEASAITGTMREHPAAVSSVLLIVGGACFALGWTLGSSQYEERHKGWW